MGLVANSGTMAQLDPWLVFYVDAVECQSVKEAHLSIKLASKNAFVKKRVNNLVIVPMASTQWK